MERLGPNDKFNPSGDPKDIGEPLDPEELAQYIAQHFDGLDITWLSEEWWVDSEGEKDGVMYLRFAEDEGYFGREVKVKVTVEILEP